MLCFDARKSLVNYLLVFFYRHSLLKILQLPRSMLAVLGMVNGGPLLLVSLSMSIIHLTGTSNEALSLSLSLSVLCSQRFYVRSCN